ncbi:Gfo/Idh/MocA family oxidoreductase [Streptomyces sp. BE147]|uniref:Gfo/Idh/MocA family protein n=1 Tax=unclassified Streptomyces TaxID=2593676 RepID=UPI0022506167|nr:MULTISPECIES: Gfo/Idh/MocA family oxidoreductase [unclassified Streptomyces]MCX4965477.1 Gfo/Idh/MocA family oxidoreductase [Streptomyces sp. NBC_00654]MEE1737643.1 Gfo/Idh/MocA family oxidoreductase [Streptomyces sp. BE147]
MSTPKPLRAGLIGLGSMGRNHARVLHGLDGVELVAAADPVAGPDSAPAGVPVVRSVAELAAEGIDYAVVACPTALHEEVALDLAERGIHALIEKPIAPSVESAERITRAFGERGLVAGVGHIERFNPALRELRTRLDLGELGDVHQVVTRRQGPFPARIADVGVVYDLATHDIDLTAWLTSSRYESVSAATVSRSGRPHEDMVAFVGHLSGGAVTSHLVNWLSPLKERVTIVTGEHGCFVADTLTADLWFYANGSQPTEWEGLRQFRGVSEGDVTRYAIVKREPLLVEHETFRDAVLGKEADIVTLEQATGTVAVAEAVLAAAANRTAIDLTSGLPLASV